MGAVLTLAGDRYERSEGVLSEGPFKRIYRAFDSEWKMEVAWNVVSPHFLSLSPSARVAFCALSNMFKSA
eukprot:1790078-Rhodomonas_salina.4